MRRLLALAVLVLAACGPTSTLPFAPAGPDAAPDPSKPGPYPVGVKTVTLYDSSRLDAAGNPRPLVTEIWYPATDAAKGKPGASYDLRSLMTPAQLEQIKGLTIPILHTFAVRDAAPRTSGAPYPLVVFSHGKNGVRWQSTFYTVNLASHGYVVVAPDHTGDTLYDLLQGANPMDTATLLQAYENRLNDVEFLIDWFTDLPKGDGLTGMIDAAHIGVTGHSFGGLTSLRVAAHDDRVKAIVPMAPASADEAFLDMPKGYTLSTPTMLEAAHDDQTLPWAQNAEPTWIRLSGPRGLFDITRGGHFTFSDLCKFDLASIADRVGFAGLNIKKTISDGCIPPAPPAAVAEPLMDQFAIGFFNWQLRGSVGSKALLTQAHADALTPHTVVFTNGF